MEFNFIQVIGIVLAVLLIVSSIIIGRKKSQKEKSTEMSEMKESKNQPSNQKDNFLLEKGASISPETNSINDIDSFDNKSTDYWQKVLDADKKVNAEKNWDRSSKKYFS
ncbi:hypothetical protein [Rummeliibacillus stabekisii]|uniref:hypothetical protein n=1 Tax=Rummeliibacillus stabekisii TaxID=241244 RepID=UPI003715C5C8